MKNDTKQAKKEIDRFFKRKPMQVEKPFFSHDLASNQEILRVTLGYIESIIEDMEHSLFKIKLMKTETNKQLKLIEINSE